MKLKEYLKGKNRKEFASLVKAGVGHINNICCDAVEPGRKLGFRIIEATKGDVTMDDLWPKK